MNNILFEGIYSATFSIYDKNMNVIKDSVEKLIKYNLQKNVRGFYVGGNTGECTVMPNKTRMQMLECVKENAGDGQIIAHIGAGHMEDTLELLEHANSVGVDAISSLPPSLTSYYKPDEIIEYYALLAKKSDSPVIAYITPVLTCDTLWFANKVMEIDNIAGIKLTIPNYNLFERIKHVNNGNINILNGPDECLTAGLISGADGAIGTTYNLIPETGCAIYDSFKAGDIKTAQKYQKRLNDLCDVLIGNNLATWKAPLEILGIDPGYTVFPGIDPSEERKKEIFARLEAAGITEEMKIY